MRFLSALCFLVSINVSADSSLVETIEKFTDIFGVSFSQFDGSTVATLDGNYYFTDRLRVFGDIDTELNWEIGTGYSFWSGESFYTENNIKASEYKISTGVFLAKMISEDWTFIADVNYNYKLDSEKCFVNFQEYCPTVSMSDSIDYSSGLIFSPIKYIDLLYKFNHEVGLNQNEYYLPSLDTTLLGDRTNDIFHEFIVFINLKYLRPSVTYTTYKDELYEDTIEFGLTFDF
ncbi:hypothetical protein AB4344_11540 [Vibrio breoganii]